MSKQEKILYAIGLVLCIVLIVAEHKMGLYG